MGGIKDDLSRAMSWSRPLRRPYIRPLHRIFFANQHPSVGTHYGRLWAQKGCVHTTVALQIMYIDYNQHWDSEYRPHRYTYSHICRLRNMSVIAQLIERSNNVGETVSRPPHALLRASSAPHTCHTSLWARRHPRRRMVRARGDRYDRCVRVAPQPRSSSTSSLALRYRFRTDISETPGVPSVALYHRTASAGPSGAALSYRRRPNPNQASPKVW